MLIFTKKLQLLKLFLMPFVLGLGFSAISFAESGSQKDTKKLTGLFDKITSIKADFEQITTNPTGEVIKENGSFIMKRSGHFVWKTVFPYKQDIVSTQENLWIIDHDLLQATLQNATCSKASKDSQCQVLPIALLTGNADQFLKDYQISHQTVQSQEAFILKPKLKNGQLFGQLTIFFRKNMIRSIHLIDSFESARKIQFTNVRQNTSINDRDFSVSIPKSYDVMNQKKP